MWGGQTMTIMDLMMFSALGVIVVLAALAIVAIFVAIGSRKDEPKAQGAVVAAPAATESASTSVSRAPVAAPTTAGAAAVPEPELDEETYAVLVAAITEEARLSGVGEIRVRSIREIVDLNGKQ